MSTYKVIQDIEAEDKLIGPLSLRQFIYAGICAVSLYLTFLVVTSGIGFVSVIFLPPAFLFGFLAFPWGRDQPTEIWALAKIRYMLKPRRRIWNQSGAKELVTITAPKKITLDYTNGLTQTEVRSRLHALADTLDSHGWAIKGANVNLYAQPASAPPAQVSDRLVNISDFPQPVSNVDVQASDDMLDERNNARAARVNTLIDASTKAHRQRIVEQLKAPTPAAQPAATPAPSNNYWFLNQPGSTTTIPSDTVTFNTQVVTPGAPIGTAATPMAPPLSEAELLKELEARKQASPMSSYYGHLRTIQPLSVQQQQAAAKAKAAANTTAPTAPAGTATTTQPPPPAQVTPAKQAAILQLANNNDLNVATIAREANRSGQLRDEVVIKLH